MNLRKEALYIGICNFLWRPRVLFLKDLPVNGDEKLMEYDELLRLTGMQIQSEDEQEEIRYLYDDISSTYFAQAREYQPERGRFTAEDVIKGNGAVPMTLNKYNYCSNNPINFWDPLGLEKVVVSGGVYEQDKYEKDEYYYEFIDASLAQINEWSKNSDEEITWIIFQEMHLLMKW